MRPYCQDYEGQKHHGICNQGHQNHKHKYQNGHFNAMIQIINMDQFFNYKL